MRACITYPEWGSHALFGRVAFDVLPEWERNLFRPDVSPEALRKPYFPPYVKTVGDKVGFLCMILDLVYEDDCRPYALLPDGRWIPHGPCDEQTQSVGASGGSYSREKSSAIVAWLMTRMVEAIRRDDWEEAIRHGGALGHLVQEPFTPGHAIDNNLFHELFPDPVSTRHRRLHHFFDCASGGSEPLPPRLMGTTIPEAAFRLQVCIDRGIVEGKRLVGPVIRSVYEGHPPAVRQALLAGQSQGAAYATACAWHTALSIAANRFDPEEERALRSLDLTELTPYFFHHWQYVALTPGCLVEKGQKIPIHVWQNDGHGRAVEELVPHGFGMGGYMGIKFYVDGDVYPSFRCRVGLPSRQREGQTEHTRTTFYVDTDRAVNTVYSEEIDYRADNRLAIPLKPGAPVQEVNVSLKGAKTLILRALTEPYTDAVTGRKCFDIPHIAVCEPRLSR
ncbi:MAG: hypothetical protein PHR35_03500 [Kiritimatiellae bacterium]|nr:hypothetical protein [Kiritimatiellia bacterium]